MADEARVQIQFSAEKGSFKMGPFGSSVTSDVTGNGGGHPGLVNIDTTYEAISFGDITPGLILFKNLDTTNYVEVGLEVSSTFYPVMKLEPGDEQLIRLAGSVSLFGKANTAACDCQIVGLSA